MNGPVELKVVEELFVRFGPVLELRLDGRAIETTGEHPFFRDGAWVAANELVAQGAAKGANGDAWATQSGKRSGRELA